MADKSALPPRPVAVVNAAKASETFTMHAPLANVEYDMQFVPASSATSLIVAVRVRPINKLEQSKGQYRDIMRVMDRSMVVVLDPDESKVSYRVSCNP